MLFVEIPGYIDDHNHHSKPFSAVVECKTVLFGCVWFKVLSRAVMVSVGAWGQHISKDN